MYLVCVCVMRVCMHVYVCIKSNFLILQRDHLEIESGCCTGLCPLQVGTVYHLECREAGQEALPLFETRKPGKGETSQTFPLKSGIFSRRSG